MGEQLRTHLVGECSIEWHVVRACRMMRARGQGSLRCCYCCAHRAKRVGSEVRRVHEAGELAQLRRREAVEIARRGQRLRWRQTAARRGGLQIMDGWVDG